MAMPWFLEADIVHRKPKPKPLLISVCSFTSQGSVGRKHTGSNGTFSAITTTAKLWSFRQKRFLCAEELSLLLLCFFKLQVSVLVPIYLNGHLASGFQEVVV